MKSIRFELVLAPILAFAGLAASSSAQSARSAVGAHEEECVPRRSVKLQGWVFTPAGSPAEGARVSSSAGGEAVVDGLGAYELETAVPLDAVTVEVSASGAAGRALSGAARVDVARVPASGCVQVAPLLLTGTPCSPGWLPTFGRPWGVSGSVEAMTLFEESLYVGGNFTEAGGAAASKIARWDGENWWPVGLDAGLTTVNALAVYNTRLFAAGEGVNRLLRWNGSTWSFGGTQPNNSVRALCVHDDGPGPALFAGGAFTNLANRVAKWNGIAWLPLGSGVDSTVETLAVFDDGAGPALYVGGAFLSAGGIGANRIAKWDGANWSALDEGLNGSVPSTTTARGLAVFDDGEGAPSLYVGGHFATAGTQAARNIAKWTGTTWSTFENATYQNPNGHVYALDSYDDGQGPAVYLGGAFSEHVAKWDGDWSLVGAGVTNHVFSLAHEGTGPTLYAGGERYVRRWDGTSWTSIGVIDSLLAEVHALTMHDDGSGTALYAAGRFTSIDGVPASRVARWNGSSWGALGSGLSSAVFALAEYDDGGGPALFAGGQTSPQPPNGRIAKWDGASWVTLGSGSFLNGFVYVLAVYDDGDGAALYAGGEFTLAGSMSANHIVRWDGASWSAVDSGVNAPVYAMTVYDDGNGAALYVGGSFTTAGGVAANRIARWDGLHGWMPLGSGMPNGGVGSFTVCEEDGGPALYVGGTFTNTTDSGDFCLAKWGCLDTTPPTIHCPEPIFVSDRSGASGRVVTFTVSASDEADPAPEVVCVPPSGSVFPRGATLVTCTATDASGNQTQCQFTVTVARALGIGPP